MSIETLLEAAKFLELQAQQQQKARGMLVFYCLYSNLLKERLAVVHFNYFFIFVYISIHALLSVPAHGPQTKSNDENVTTC